MGGGGFSSCQKKGFSLFGVCLFFGGFGRFEIEGLPPQKKNIGGKTWAGPPNTVPLLFACVVWDGATITRHPVGKSIGEFKLGAG